MFRLYDEQKKLFYVVLKENCPTDINASTYYS